MILEILLICSVILQLVAAIAAVRLISKTKYNLSWMLFTIALCLMAFMRLGEYIQVAGFNQWRLPRYFFVWTGVVTSLFCAVGVLLVQRIFKDTYVSEQKRRISERRILGTVIRTEEAERKRFSRELHDGLGPLLSSAKMSLSALSLDGLDERNKYIISNTKMVIDEAVRSLKEVATNLSPHILNDFGLNRAITNFINKIPVSGINISFDTDLRDQRLGSHLEVILYRVVCELINNTITHASADRIDITINRLPGCIRMEYCDNGRGFDPEAETGGMGISNMASRVGSVKGEFVITSSVGKGMSAIIEIPI